MTRLQDQRILVTGGGGFLGSHVVEQLKSRGCRNVFVARSREFDLVSEAGAMRMFEEHPADIVFHLAGYVGGLGANKTFPGDFFYRNLMMGAHVLHLAYKTGAKKVIAAGAGCGYPEAAPLPIKEADYWNGYPQDDSAPYSLAKRMLHVQSFAYWRQFKFPILVAIPGNIYGPYDNFDLEAAHVIPALVRKFVEAADDGKPEVEVWGTGRATRDFVYAGDVAEGMIRMAERIDEPVLLNMACGADESILQVVNALTAITGFRGQIKWLTDRPEGQARRMLDMTLTQEKLGFRCGTTLHDGLTKTVEWYRANRRTARNTVDTSEAVTAA